MKKSSSLINFLKLSTLAIFMAALGVLPSQSFGQSSLLVYGEYYFDTDPGFGSGAPLIFTPDSVVDLNLNVPLTGLIPGQHNLHVRFQDDSGRWTHDNVFPVIVTPYAPIGNQGPSLTGIEFAFDNDPGIGQGNFLPNIGGGTVFNALNTLAVDTLPGGFHKVFIRAKDSIGNWSHTYTSSFYLFDSANNLQSPEMVEVEYFFDQDSGFGTGTIVTIPRDSLISFRDSVNIRALATGYHTLYVRVKDEEGHWSHTYAESFFVTQDTNRLPVLVAGEYYFDSDPGYGNGAPMPGWIPDSVIDVSFQIPINSLTPGVHRLYTRVQDDRGLWSHNYVGPFMRMPSNLPTFKPMITNMEYYFDTDPGEGNGTPIAVGTPDSILSVLFMPALDTLAIGFHTLYIRSKDTIGKWSHTFRSTFYLFDSLASSNPLLAQGEYFWDTDPGFGNGTQIVFNPDSVVQVADTISIAGLSTGIHRLYIRVQDEDSIYSLVYSQSVFIIDDNGGVDPRIIAAEYFVDADPGFGNGTPIAVDTSLNILDTTFTVNTTGLSIGGHKLYVRVLDDRNNWSIAYIRDIVIIPESSSSNSPNIIAAEYFFNNDPGFGNAYPISGFNSDSIINIVSTFPVDTLPVGFHTIFIRTMDTNGIWSLTYNTTFYLFDSTISISPLLTGGEYFWDTDPGFGNGTPIAVNQDSLVQIADTISIASLGTGIHTLYIRVVDTNLAWSQVYTRTVFIVDDNNGVDPKILAAEFFVDVDPGEGNGTPITVDTSLNTVDTSFLVPTNGLALGSHKLYVRVLDDRGNWSINFIKDFVVIPEVSNDTGIVFAAEYFFNNDPGFGNGHPLAPGFAGKNIVNLIPTLAVDTLPVGFHTLYIRTLDTNGNWSLTYNTTFYLFDSSISISPLLTGGEYFWDTDPGFGNATPIAINPDSLVQIADTISIAGLSTGIHNLYLRVIDSNLAWSQVYVRTVFIVDDNMGRDPTLVAAEYFIDVDPGEGNGTAIAVDTSLNVVDTTFFVSTNGLSIGAHKLYVRALDSRGNWSINYIRDIIIIPDGASSTSPLIVAAEYYFNNDPGFGNANPIAGFSPDSIINIVSNIPVDTLPVGFHTIYLRTMDTNGNWSLTYRTTFYLFDSSISISPLLTGGEYFWDTDPGFGNGNSIAINPDSLVQIADTISIAGLGTGIHTLYIRVVDTNLAWSQVYTRTLFIVDDNGGVDPLIVAAEFFIDIDPGEGSGTAIAVDTSLNVIDTSFSVQTNGLSIGAHKLYVRVLDSRGNWSINYIRDIIIIPDGSSSSATNIIAAEYFFDNDPGIGGAYPLSGFTPDSVVNIVSNLPVDTLPTGFHTIYIRTMDSNGIWSLTYSSTFYLFDSGTFTSPLLVGGEYYWDTDPGFGNGTQLAFNPDSVVQVADTISISGLSTGYHTLYIRSVDSTGAWSLNYSATVWIYNDGGGTNPVIVSAEYFINIDPGFGNGTSIPVDTNGVIDTTFSVNLSGLVVGSHKLYVRTLDDQGNWSLTYTRDIIVIPDGSSSSSPVILAAEYFFDNDPGFGNGYPIAGFSPDSIVNIVSNIPVDTLPTGFHTIFIRTLDSNGNWSLTYSSTFYLFDSTINISPLLTGGEYFWDTDPGFGNGNSIAVNPDSLVQIADTISLAGLSTGMHTLYIRVVDTNAAWSVVYTRTVFIVNDNNGVDPIIVSAEYFIDVDPGLGNGTPISVDSAGVIDTTFTVNLAGLTIGSHKLYIRTLDDLGNWSLTYNRDIIVIPDGSGTSTPQILAAEYFFNNDPGFGNAYPLSGFSPDSIVNIVSAIPVDTLPVGFHTIYLRTLDSNGQWSLTYQTTFYLFDSTINITPLLTGGEYFWDTDPGFGNGNPIAVNTDSLVQIADTISLVGLSTGMHTLYIRVVDTNQVWSIVYTRTVFIVDDNNGADPLIVSAEYFIDTDPGEGNGVPIAVDTNNVIDTTFFVDLSGLTIGSHKLYVRTLDDLGNWSLNYIRDIVVIPDGSGTATPPILAAEYFFNNDPGFGNAYALTGFSPDSIVNIVSTLPVDTLPIGFHTIYIRTLDSLGQWSLTYQTTFYLFDSTITISPLLTGGEYFWDTDPGFGNGNPIAVNTDSLVQIADTISIAGLSTGIHTLYIRVVDTNQVWSQVYTRTVFIVDDNNGLDPLIVAAEYFIDIDPGLGLGTPIAVDSGSVIDTNFTVNTAGLSIGAHKLYVRTLDDLGNWSLTFVRDIVIIPDGATSSSPLIVAAEYFFNNDPGFGNGITISNFSPDSIVNIVSTLPVDTLPVGFHTIYIRTLDTNGNWSLTYQTTFYLFDSTITVTPLLTGGEYFWDTDPGFGNGNSIAVNADSLVQIADTISIANLSTGMHTLYIRVVDTNQTWSLVYTRTVFIVDDNNGVDPKILAAEFFIDTDPGEGNGTAIAVDTSLNVIDTSFTVPTSGLSIGAHKLYVRVLDSRGNWSINYIRDIIIVPDGATSTSPLIVAAEYFFNNDPGFGNAYPISGFSPDSIINIVSTIPVDTLPTGFHTIYIRTLDSNGNWAITYNSTFYLFDSTINITPLLTGGEYFWDTDPGFGSGNPIAVNQDSLVQISDTISIAGLSTGMHTLYIRVVDSTGTWSLVYTKTVFVVDDNNGVQPLIVAAEYFIDIDPGEGNGTAIALTSDSVVDLSFPVPFTGLSTGLHRLYVRTLDDRGNWSLNLIKPIVVLPVEVPTASPVLVSGEYFFNTDPGFGAATSFSFAQDSIIDVNEIVSLSSLTNGLHVLYIRTKDTLGQWGMTHRWTVYVSEDQPTPQLNVTAFEYFWDNDPGFGNGTIIPVGSPDVITHDTANIQWCNLSDGVHRLYIRPIDASGRFGLSDFADVILSDSGSGSFNMVVASNSPICSGSDIELRVDSLGGPASFRWFGPTGALVGTNQITYVSNATIADSGDYAVEVSQGGCFAYDTVTVEVLPGLPLANWIADTAICVPDTITLDATVNGYPDAIYLWSTGDTTPTIQTYQRDTFSVYVVDTLGVCETRDTVIVDLNITYPRVWNGSVSSDWMTHKNWSCGGVPDETVDVMIPDVSLQGGVPALVGIGQDAKIRTIEVMPGAKITIQGYIWVNEP